jgi:hypothetical protein
MGIIDSVLSIGSTILDRVIPDKNARDAAKEELARAINDQDFQLALEQIKVNEAEASSDNLFKSGWRPAIGWVCGIAFSLHFVFFPILDWFLVLFGHTAIVIPFDMSTLMTVLGGLLGLGSLRTFEKMKGVA